LLAKWSFDTNNEGCLSSPESKRQNKRIIDRALFDPLNDSIKDINWVIIGAVLYSYSML
jgi:hypothetical protein